jgi:hypothetical protein
MRRFGCLLLLATMLLPLHPVPVAAAASNASCHHEWTDTISPGVTSTVQRVHFTSNGERWALVCQGTVRGSEVTGPGTFGEEGVLDGSCSTGGGTVNFSFSIPTTAGMQRFHLTFQFRYAGGVGGSSNDAFPGVFAFSPKTGDCVSSPVTEVDIVRAGQLRGG